MDEIYSDNMQTNYKITPKPIENDKIALEVKRQYIRLGLLILFVSIIIILSLKEYMTGLEFIKDLSILEQLKKNYDD